ncbi:MAG: transcriptional regulator, GntR family [Clostridiaceae bacterium]|jgi:DNA-binding GntR family transcriptional regulator|nr:transcriptional regulator, GntR family [Clostridiaceae bacterium]MDF2951634.1 transcriptional regulator, GntR family [Anaerocolumna sp.]
MQIMERTGKETAREYAFRVIKQNIISLELIPGTMVSENELAAQMGISRTPVREALIELSKLKVVEIYPQKGSVIAQIDSELVEEARYVRLVLETAIAELACDVASSEDIFLLEENLRLQEFYMDNPANEKKLQLDDTFHELLFTICKKNFTHKLLEGMMTHFDRARSLSLQVIKDSKTISDHRVLVDAIKNQDKELARATITKHLSRYKVDETELRMKYPNYFK